MSHFYSPEFKQNPYPFLKQIRESKPIFFDEMTKSWILTEYQHIVEILSDKRFGRNPHRVWADNSLEHLMANWFVFQNAPVHTRNRRLFNKAFTPKNVMAIEPLIEKMISELLDELSEKDENK